MIDPISEARKVGDVRALESWERMEIEIDRSLLVAVPPDPFLIYLENSFDSVGPSQELLDRSKETITAAYREAFTRSFGSATGESVLIERPYTPPSGYMRGGPIGGPWELIELADKLLVSVDLVEGVIHNLISSAIWDARHHLASIFQRNSVPADKRPYGTVGTVVVRSVCADHALHAFSNRSFGRAAVYRAAPASADYPAQGNLFTVVIPYEDGSIVYVVGSDLHLFSMIDVRSTSSVDVNRATWYEHFPEDERPPL